jgi:internalin A
VAKLPPPQEAFGLHLGDTKVTNAGLKELATLKTLHTLVLSSAPVSNAGLTELAGLKALRALDLTDTKVLG